MTILPFSVGDRAPQMVGATSSGQFFSLDAQAGRPALIVALGALEPEAAASLITTLLRARPELAAAGIDLVPLAPPTLPFTSRFAADPSVADFLVFLTWADGLEALQAQGATPAMLIDRGARIVEVLAITEKTDVADLVKPFFRRVSSSPPQVHAACAPALLLPNVASPELCKALIAHFEASPHAAGVMASFSDQGAYAKLDETKKKRRDTELTPDCPLYQDVLALLSRRVAPEIKRAFQVDIANADRILIARYDDTGGYFRRHRDNGAPHTAFREFAISLNLNTDEYEGGELLFPEFDDHRYNPPAGGAIVFSASLLHEAAPVTKGSRYVLLSFLGSAAAQVRLNTWLESQNTKVS